jgi:drug/metabolite transporter (DMT)-like permease
MDKAIGKWVLYILLSFIWGSSFILMKEGLLHLSAFQVASVRIVASGLVLLPIAIKSFKTVPTNKLPVVFLSGSLGSLFPAYLFCIAEQGIDSSLAGTLNSLTPIFVLVTGFLFFNNKTTMIKVICIVIAFLGSVLLFITKPHMTVGNNLIYILFVILATFFYGLNVNLVQRHLKEIPSLQIVSMALVMNAIPALVMLVFSGFFALDFNDNGVWVSIGFSCILGAIGTSVANILFYMLIKKAGVVFSSMVTYGIPFIAILWGIIYKERVGWLEVLCLSVILLGVYIANKKGSNN